MRDDDKQRNAAAGRESSKPAGDRHGKPDREAPELSGAPTSMQSLLEQRHRARRDAFGDARAMDHPTRNRLRGEVRRVYGTESGAGPSMAWLLRWLAWAVPVSALGALVFLFAWPGVLNERTDSPGPLARVEEEPGAPASNVPLPAPAPENRSLPPRTGNSTPSAAAIQPTVRDAVVPSPPASASAALSPDGPAPKPDGALRMTGRGGARLSHPGQPAQPAQSVASEVGTSNRSPEPEAPRTRLWSAADRTTPAPAPAPEPGSAPPVAVAAGRENGDPFVLASGAPSREAATSGIPRDGNPVPSRPVASDPGAAIQAGTIPFADATGHRWRTSLRSESAGDWLARGFDQFTAVHSNGIVRLIGTDGSVYSGAMVDASRVGESQTGTSTSIAASGRTRTNVRSKTVRRFAVDPPDPGEGRWVAGPFQVGGTNRTLSRPIVITGWMPFPVDPNASGAPGAPGAPGTAIAPPADARITARVAVSGGTNELRFEAVPVAVQAPVPAIGDPAGSLPRPRVE